MGTRGFGLGPLRLIRAQDPALYVPVEFFFMYRTPGPRICLYPPTAPHYTSVCAAPGSSILLLSLSISSNISPANNPAYPAPHPWVCDPTPSPCHHCTVPIRMTLFQAAHTTPSIRTSTSRSMLLTIATAHPPLYRIEPWALSPCGSANGAVIELIWEAAGVAPSPSC